MQNLMLTIRYLIIPGVNTVLVLISIVAFIRWVIEIELKARKADEARAEVAFHESHRPKYPYGGMFSYKHRSTIGASQWK